MFNAYDPPRIAVAEAWVPAHRRARYASAHGLGQAFNFDLLEADFDALRFREIITLNLELAADSGSSTTWVFSNHDVVRHATRYGLPPRGDNPTKQGREWLLTYGAEPKLDRGLGLRRARAATMLVLALPGSTYLYQGEELGLHEVADIPDDTRQDPTFFRSDGADVGRDGCRVPLPWTRQGASFGFGDGDAHLPQPCWFADHAVEVQDGDPDSTLTLYRTALALRRELQTEETMTWIETDSEDVLAFRRPGGWVCVTNFGDSPVSLPDGEILLTSTPLNNGQLPGAASAWLHP